MKCLVEFPLAKLNTFARSNVASENTIKILYTIA